MTLSNNTQAWYNIHQVGKIFGIGLTKTGTLSLSQALNIIGYKSKHYPISLDEINEYEATTDIPVSCRYKELDIMYPNSKFILTTRNFESWIETTSRKPLDKHKPSLWKIETRLRMYGVLHWDRTAWTTAYDTYHENVRRYFSKRDNYLELPLESIDKWDILCQFLNKSKPLQPYPNLNKSINVFKLFF